MPTRILREGIITSPRVIQLSWPAEVFYRRLMSVVDDFGRYHAHPALLRAACYPLQLEKVSEADVGKWLAEVRKADLVSVYEISGAPYLEVHKFKQQLRAKQSKFPEPDNQLLSDGKATDKQSLILDVGEDEGGGGSRRKRRSPKTDLPNDFKISERVIAWAKEKGFKNLDRHYEHFVSKARAKGYTYVDWDEGFMTAIRDDWAKVGASKNPQDGVE